MDFADIRKEYEETGLRREQLNEDPFELARIWLVEAMDRCPGKWFESNAMTLATTDSGGRASARIVLLKEIVAEGIVFYTNYESRKGLEIDSNRHVGTVIHWPYLGRQMRICGSVTKTSREVSEVYFHSRPRRSQISALVSRQSSSVSSRSDLEAAFEQAERQFEKREIPLPDDWGGYLLRPTEFEFWQGRRDRLHDRFRFSRSETGWTIQRLAP